MPDDQRRDTPTSTTGSVARGSTDRETAASAPTDRETAASAPTDRETAVNPTYERREVVARQKEEFGGLKFGSDFFGWLTATGTAVLLTALVAGLGAAIGLGNGATADDAAANANTVGLVGGIALLVITFIAYLAGGYVAGRMARFSGLKQGLGVWLWAVVVAVIVAVIGVIAGAQFDILARLNGFPRIPVNEGTLTTAGLITAVGVAVVSLVAALLGGLLGMRYHRKVDRFGLPG
jgi:hypothetical protein